MITQHFSTGNRLPSRIFLLAGAFFAAQSFGAAEILSLDDAVRIAVEHNHTLQNTVLDVQKAEDKWKAGRTHLFPSFNVTALGSQPLNSLEFTLEKGVLGNYFSTGPLPENDVHLKSPMSPNGLLVTRVSQPLTSLIRIRRNLDGLKTGIALANEQTRMDRQKVVREVKQAYYSLQQAQSSLRSVQETLALYQELERLTENYVAGAIVLRSELLDVRSRLAKTLQNELVLRDQLATGKEQVNQLLGRDITVDFEVQPVLESGDQQLDLRAARDAALKQRPELRQAALRQKQAEQDLRAKRAEYIPDVSAQFNSASMLNYGSFLPKQNSSIGVSLSWEPFDWGRRRHEIAEKSRTITQAKHAERDAENSILLDVGAKYRQLRQSRAQLQVARLSQEAAIEGLRVSKNKYAVQAALLKDVLQGQVTLEQSNTDFEQALISFWNARADFERALGEE